MRREGRREGGRERWMRWGEGGREGGREGGEDAVLTFLVELPGFLHVPTMLALPRLRSGSNGGPMVRVTILDITILPRQCLV